MIELNDLKNYITSKIGTKINIENDNVFNGGNYILEFEISKIFYDDKLKTPKLKIDIILYKHILKLNVGYYTKALYKFIDLSNENDIKNGNFNNRIRMIVEKTLSEVICQYYQIPTLETIMKKDDYHVMYKPLNISVNKINWNIQENNAIKI